MNRAAVAVVALLVGAAALGSGYWWGAKNATQVPGALSAPASKSERKILYYRNPMGLPDTSPVPKKAPDGMDYVAVYEDEQGVVAQGPGANTVKISVDKVQKLGVKTEAVSSRDLTRTVRAIGLLQADERRLFTVAPKFDGYIQKLYVNTTGAPVRRGEPLMDVYSPDLVIAQQEYLIAARGLASLSNAPADGRDSMQRLMDSTLMRLRNWDIAAEDLQELQREGRPRQYVTLRSRASGVVVEKPSIEGKRFMAGDPPLPDRRPFIDLAHR